MNEKATQQKLYSDFNNNEIKKLATKPARTVSQIANADCVIIDDSKEDSMMNYLQSWFLDTFTGDPIEMPWSEFLIELTLYNNQGKIKIFCCKQKNDWVSLDIFLNGWLYIGKIMYPNVKCEEADRIENGQFMVYTPFLYVGQKIEVSNLQTFIAVCKDTFTYAAMYVMANHDVKEVYIEKNKKVSSTSKPKKGSNKRKSAIGREKIYVPKRRVYTVKKLPSTNECIRNYLLSHWKVKGYSYTRKDGRVINVKEHIARRHLPNKGLTNPTGKDYILWNPNSNSLTNHHQKPV